MFRSNMRTSFIAYMLVIIAMATARPAHAQLLTQHLKGAIGLKGGSQAPPGGYIVAPLVYFYNTDTVRDLNGDRVGQQVGASPDLTVAFFGVGYSQVTTKKILGASYGFMVLFPVGANNRIQGTEIDLNPGAGLTDSVIQPISLGWHSKRADATAAFTMYVPTGKYTDGADDNTGLGMWGFEPGFGATVYLNDARQYHAATMVTLNFQSKKEDSETKVGNQINFEGGVGGDFLKGGLTAGLAYYASFKLSDDEIEGVPAILIRGKNKAFGLGPEATLAIATKSTVYGFVTLRYFWETYARTTTQGQAFLIQATLLTKPVKIPTP
jgi:hypothetical protein